MTRALPFVSARGLSRVEAARYVGVSPSTFDKLVTAGTMPNPKRLRGRLVFDRVALDFAFEKIDQGADGEEPNDFDDVLK